MIKPPYTPQRPTNMPKYLGLIILVLFAFMLGWNVGANHAGRFTETASKNTVISAEGKSETVDMRLFWDTWNVINGKYVDPHKLDTQNMIFGAIHGMVSALEDPYTSFMTPKENKEFQDSMQGTLEGIGAELTLRNGLLTVISPVKDSPAKRAGIQPEDIIYKVNDETTESMGLEQAVMKIRGPKGTFVTLTILRKGHNEPIVMKIMRDSISIASVDWKIEDGIAILSINQFGDNTKDEFGKAVSDILGKRPKGIVLDLRYNGGGYLEGAVDIASEFMEKGKVVTIKKRNPEEDETISVSGSARMTNIPLVVLINKGSASASEIVAGAIQDNKRGIVMGESSFGKGTVQEVENLLGGSSLRVTIAKWFTPDGHNITEVGITPDIAVERTAKDMEDGNDTQIKAAIEYLQKKAQ